MIPDKNFRMTKASKTRLALMKVSKEQKDGWKHMFIDAQLSEEAARRATLKTKDNSGFGNRTRGAVAPD